VQISETVGAAPQRQVQRRVEKYQTGLIDFFAKKPAID
jgi:hypothetical protein